MDKTVSSGATLLQHTHLARFVQSHTLDCTYNQVRGDFPPCFISWIMAYAVDKIIRPLNNWGFDIMLFVSGQCLNSATLVISPGYKIEHSVS